MTDETRNTSPQLTQQDAEQLSAYLDNMLTSPERAQLEARLDQNAFLRRELDAMRRTVQAINALPTLKAPRDFTLDPAQIAASGDNTPRIVPPAPRRQRRVAPIGFAAVLALMLFGLISVITLINLPGDDPALEIASAPTETPIIQTFAESADDAPEIGTTTDQGAEAMPRSIAPPNTPAPPTTDATVFQMQPQSDEAARTGEAAASQTTGEMSEMGIQADEASESLETTAAADADLMDEIADLGPARRLQNVLDFIRQIADSVAALFNQTPSE